VNARTSTRYLVIAPLLACCAACGGSASSGGGASGDGTGSTAGDGTVYGDVYQGGQFHLGPVDWDESEYHNACAPPTKYAAKVQAVEGTLLAGLWNGIAGVAGYCDACIAVTTAQGKSALLRVVTYGDTTTNSIDVSPSAYAVLNSGEYPRTMTWQLAKCPDTGKLLYEFETGANAYWTALWVRNARVPIAKVEVQSPSHAAFTALTRQSDGSLWDSSGFGSGGFTLRVTAVDGQQVTDAFAWPSAGIGGQLLEGQGNFE
jgi:expansin